MDKKKSKLPKAAIVRLVSMAEEASRKLKDKSAKEIFQSYLMLMGKYRDYFFSEPWPKKFDYKHVTTFTHEDIDFMDENDDEYADRVLTVLLKKNMSLAGFNKKGGMMWANQAFYRQLILPELKSIFDAFRKLAETDITPQKILAKLLKNECGEISVIHWAFLDLLGEEGLDGQLDLKASEILELIHTQEGYPECEASRCKYQREKLKKKT
jgi:hypothetical protein